MNVFLKKLRKYEIRIRKIVNTHMQGDFHSVFKGSGLEFEDVRAYQYGDDVRSIDWNVTAKGHGIYVKTFREEKEQNIFLVLDVSGSQEIGNPEYKKIDVGKEICGVLALTAAKEASQTGLLCFSDKKERYVTPKKGLKHAYEIISNLYHLAPSSSQTSINEAILFIMNVLKKKSVVIFVSDFIDDRYEKNLIALSKKHDLIVIHLSDKREKFLPRLGIIPLYDKEKRKVVWANSSSATFRKRFKKEYLVNQHILEKLCKRYQADYLAIDTNEDYILKLVKLFKTRNNTKAKKSAS